VETRSCRSSFGRRNTYDMRKISQYNPRIPALAANSENGCRFPLHRLDDRSQPQIMIQIAGQDPEYFQLEPLHAPTMTTSPAASTAPAERLYTLEWLIVTVRKASRNANPVTTASDSGECVQP